MWPGDGGGTDLDLVSVAAAASRMGVSGQTVRAMVKDGKLDRVFTGKGTGCSRCYMVTVESIKRWRNRAREQEAEVAGVVTAESRGIGDGL
jgi:excisionase family DNA binding protein